MSKPRIALTVLISLAASPLVAQQHNDWYLLRIGGTPVGWFHEVREPSDSGIWTATRMRIVLNRLGSQVVMEVAERSLESVNGDFLRTEVTMRMSQQASELRARRDGDSVRVATAAGSKEFTRSLPAGGALLGPAGVARRMAGELRAPGDSMSYRVFFSPIGAPAVITRTLVRDTTLLIAGQALPARQVVERTPASPTPVSVWLDTGGRTLRTAYDSPFGRTEMDLADSAMAARADAGGELSEEQYARTLVRTGIKLPQSRRIESLRLALSMDGKSAWPSLEGDGQRVIEQSPGRLVLEITRRHPPPGPHSFPVVSTAATREYLEPNAYIQSDDSVVRELSRRVVGNETDAWRAALALERWVSDSMHFDLGVAFAPSVEVVRRRRGTCVAYATLLAAMTRSLGIPSRIAFGYVYVNGMFGGHAWTEVLLGDAWVPVDGAVVAEGSSDAARFAFAWGSLAGGPAEFIYGPGARLYNGIGARILGWRLTGERPVAADTSAPPYRTNGDAYRNDVFGFSFVKPAEFRFTALDETWPSMVVAGIDGPGGRRALIRSFYRDPWVTPRDDARVRLEKADSATGTISELRVAGGPAWMRASPSRALMAFPYGGETVVVEASGPEAAALLRRIAATVRLGKIPWK